LVSVIQTLIEEKFARIFLNTIGRKFALALLNYATIIV